jgi:DNA processing protein
MGVVVIEAAEKSGSLITARIAADLGREVFALPGPISSPISGGCHKLIQQGAKLVCSPKEVLEDLIFEKTLL